jgi:N-acyl-D-aspartate/D-glutamate deacylase
MRQTEEGSAMDREGAVAADPAPLAVPCDVLIAGGRVVDGTGNPWFYGDVALAGDRVARIAPAGRLDRAAAGEVVEARGMVVAPGFIDIQSHSILPFFSDGRGLSKVTQGVTTEIMGEAWTPAPFGGRIASPFRGAFFTGREEWEERARGWRRFGDWLADLEARGVSQNVGSFIGGATVREWGKAMDLGEATPDELAAMCRVTAEALEDGAFGVATALIYPPGAFAGTDELAAIARVVGRYGGVYITHIRSESERLLEGLDEALEIGRRGEVPVEIYHLKAAGRASWHKLPATIERINAARAAGQDVTADMYPYIASGTGLSACLPPWAAAGGRLYENLRDPAMRATIRAEVLRPSGDWEDLATRTGPEGVLVCGLRRPEHAAYVGKRLSEIAALRGEEWVDTILNLLAAEGQRIFTVYFGMSEENLALQMRQPWIKFSTDAGALDPATAGELTHPRAYGTYPRVLGKYVREEGVIPLEDAVRKMTSAVADRLGLRDRGVLRAGHFADVVVFDPETIADRATFTAPHQLSVGVRDVWVNGARVLAGGEHTGALPGRFVRRS